MGWLNDERFLVGDVREFALVRDCADEDEWGGGVSTPVFAVGEVPLCATVGGATAACRLWTADCDFGAFDLLAVVAE